MSVYVYIYIYTYIYIYIYIHIHTHTHSHIYSPNARFSDCPRRLPRPCDADSCLSPHFICVIPKVGLCHAMPILALSMRCQFRSPCPCAANSCCHPISSVSMRCQFLLVTSFVGFCVVCMLCCYMTCCHPISSLMLIRIMTSG